MTGEAVKLPVHKVSVRSCPNCHHLVTQLQVELQMFDEDCPKCGKHKTSEFEIEGYEL